MSDESVLDAAALRDAGRDPATPFRVALADGSEVVVSRLLRVLPGKRIVGEGQWQGQRVLVKLFVGGASARHWRHEKAGVDALQCAGIQTPELLLAASLPTGGHVVLTRYLDAAQSLAQAWHGVADLPVGDRAALDVLCPAFRLLGAMHAAGLVQQDLHLGNFLRCAGRIFVIDGDAVRAIAPGKPLDAQQSARNLAILLAQLPIAWDDARDVLLEAYRAEGGDCRTESARLRDEVARARDWRLADFLGKTLRDCTLFAVRRSAFRFSAVARGEGHRLAPLLASPDEAIARGTLLKDGRTCTVAQVELVGRSLIVKRYNLKNLPHFFARCWRPSRAWHSWREGHRLRFLGISTPAPLALVEERVGPLRRRAFLVCEYCPGQSLLDLLSPDREPDDDVARAIVSLFSSLHALRISHGDLKATNLLFHEGKVVVIDLDGVRQHRTQSAYARAWRRDRARLLRNWPASCVLQQWLDSHLPPAR
ncbi:MAG: serine/threonine protein kinase [Proteobacteria bacterium]|nr:serine/threonine protein kinase [Pseudomonadota bacterium]